MNNCKSYYFEPVIFKWLKVYGSFFLENSHLKSFAKIIDN
jgi:hypothetical protein